MTTYDVSNIPPDLRHQALIDELKLAERDRLNYYSPRSLIQRMDRRDLEDFVLLLIKHRQHELSPFTASTALLAKIKSTEKR